MCPLVRLSACGECDIMLVLAVVRFCLKSFCLAKRTTLHPKKNDLEPSLGELGEFKPATTYLFYLQMNSVI